jgi:hypothetical protein
LRLVGAWHRPVVVQVVSEPGSVMLDEAQQC